MGSILKTMQESPYAWAILSLITIVSLLFGIYSWVSGKKFKRLTYTRETNKLISLKNVAVDSLHLFFNKEEIMDVSITRFAVWNSGNERIDSKDIVASRLLRTGLKEGHKKDSRILNCSIDYVTDDTIFGDINPAEIELVSDTYTIPIDYLAPSDGMIIQIVHTGDNDDLYMDCHIKGGKEFDEVDNYVQLKKQNKIINFGILSSTTMASAIFAGLVGIVTSIILELSTNQIIQDENTSSFILVISAILPVLFIFTVALFVFICFINRIKIPKKLNENL